MDDIESLIPYDEWMIDGLRRIVYFAMWRTSKYGLPGDHHFYVTFKTQHPGVYISPSLRARFPEEMRIVIQHQYSNLEVDEKKFSICLRFNNVPETLTVPYVAISQFVDPTVHFSLDFEVEIDSLSTDRKKPSLQVVDISGHSDDLPLTPTEKSAELASSAELKSASRSSKTGQTKSSKKSNTEKVVTLDAFRQMKKENNHE